MKKRKLSEFFPDQNTSVDPAKFSNEEFELYSIPAYDRGTPERTFGSGIGSAKKAVQPGDVLLSRIIPHIRRAWVVPERNSIRQIASGEWIIFRSAEFHPEYVRHFLLSDPFHAQFMQTVAGVGGSLLRARPQGVGLIEIPLPHLDEQRRIAAILDQADALRRMRRRAIQRLNDLEEAIFYEMFIVNADGSWPRYSVEDVALNIRTGPFGSQLLHSEFTNEGVAVLGIDNAVENEFRWGERRFISLAKYEQLKRYTVYPGDVIITIMGTCGRCAVVPEGVPLTINTKHLCCITLDKSIVLPQFLHAAFLRHPDVLNQLGVQAKGAIMPGLNMGIINKLAVRVPPMNLQRNFVGRIELLNKMRHRNRQGMSKLDDLFSSLQHRAFRGELTLPLPAIQ